LATVRNKIGKMLTALRLSERHGNERRSVNDAALARMRSDMMHSIRCLLAMSSLDQAEATRLLHCM